MMPLPNHHPLYSLAAKACIALLGEKEWVVRLPAFIAGSLTPPLVYLVGERWIGRRTGILAGVFFVLGFWPLWFSQDARGYAFMIFFSLLATHLFLALSERFSRRDAVIYLLAGVAAIYSHLYAINVLAGHLLAAAMVARKAGIKPALRLGALSLSALAASALLYAPFIPDPAPIQLDSGEDNF